MRVILQIWPFGVILQNLTPKNIAQKIWKRKVKKSVSYHPQWQRNRQFKIWPVITGIPVSGLKIEERYARYQIIDSHLFLEFSKSVHPSSRKTRPTDHLTEKKSRLYESEHRVTVSNTHNFVSSKMRRFRYSGVRLTGRTLSILKVLSSEKY